MSGIRATGKQTVIFQVITVACTKMTIIWETAPCSPVKTDRRFKDDYCLHHQCVHRRDSTDTSHECLILAIHNHIYTSLEAQVETQLLNIIRINIYLHSILYSSSDNK
jgi:hypothetical protein